MENPNPHRSVRWDLARGEVVDTYEAIVQGWGKVVQVQPDVERGHGWNVYFQSQLLKSLENVISFRLEMLLQGQLQTTIPQ